MKCCDACGKRQKENLVMLKLVFQVDGIVEVCGDCEASAEETQVDALHLVDDARDEVTRRVQQHLLDRRARLMEPQG